MPKVKGKFMHKILVFGLSTLLVITLTYLAEAEMSAKAKMGRELFYSPSFNGTLDSTKVTGLSCASCHADFDETANPDGRIRSGHSIIGVPHRGEAKGGAIKGEMFKRSAGGSGYCYQHFLQNVSDDKVDATAIPAEQAEALMAYFEYVSGDNKGPKFQMKMLDKTAADAAANKIVAMKSDSKQGWKMFSKTCTGCHPTPKKAGIGPQLVRSRPPADMEKRKRQVASYIRKGGFLMPPFADDRLSDQDIADIVAFISELSGGK